MVFLPPPLLSPKPSIGKGILGLVGINHASGVPTIVGVEENNEPAYVLFSFLLFCPHIEQAVEPQSSKIYWKSLTSRVRYLSQQYMDKREK